MSVAAHALPAEDRTDWLDELELILNRWGGLSITAQTAVTEVIQSFLDDSETSPTDAATARRLLTQIRPASASRVVHSGRPVLATA